jgi:hypothetical protein
MVQFPCDKISIDDRRNLTPENAAQVDGACPNRRRLTPMLTLQKGLHRSPLVTGFGIDLLHPMATSR